MDTCKVVKVIYNSCKRRGSGKPGDPHRVVEQLFTVNGRLLVELDPGIPELNRLVYTKHLNPEH